MNPRIDIQISKTGHEYWELTRCEVTSLPGGSFIYSHEMFARVFLDYAQDRYVAEAALWEHPVRSQPKWIRINKVFLKPDIAFRFLAKGGKVEA